MTDLHAPLVPNRRARPAVSPAASRRALGWRRGALFATLLGGLLVANWGLVSFADRDPQTALLVLPEPVEVAGAPDTGITTGTVPTARTENGVQILYGDVDRQTLAPPSTPSITDPEGGLASGGGPKVITVRDPAAVGLGQPVQVAHLPEDAALEDTAFGPLPVRADDGRRPMDIYARPWSGMGGKRIAIVIGGLGLSQTGSNRAIDVLPPEITLGFAPTGNSLERWMRAARRKGHELLLQVPMEPFGYPQIDPGPRTLTVDAAPQDNLENLHWAMGRITNYTGIATYMGGRFAADEASVSPVLGDLAYRGLLLFSDGSASGERLAQAARATGVPHVQANRVIDTVQDRAAIIQALEELEQIATARGYAVGSGSAFEVTVTTVAEWANEAKKRGVEIVGVAALAGTAR